MRLLRRAADRKSTRLNSSHLVISYAVFCLKKKTKRLDSSHLVRSHPLFRLQRTPVGRVCRAERSPALFRRSACVSSAVVFLSFFFNDTATTEIYTLSLHDALPI